MQGDRLTYTVEEAAKLLGVSRAHAYGAVHAGEIPVVRIGKRLLVPKVALEEMLGRSAQAKAASASPTGR